MHSTRETVAITWHNDRPRLAGIPISPCYYWPNHHHYYRNGHGDGVLVCAECHPPVSGETVVNVDTGEAEGVEGIKE